MAAGRLSPRQKMINMMYLVLTALLALNVSKEVLNSFFEVNLGIIKTTETVKEKSEATFQDLTQDTRDKVRIFERKAKEEVKIPSDELDEFIQSMKHSLVLSVDNKVYLGEYQLKNADGEMVDIKDLENDNPTTKAYDELSAVQKDLNIAWLGNKSDRNTSAELFNPENKSSFPVDENGDGLATQLRKKITSFEKQVSILLNEMEKRSLVQDPTFIIKEIHALIHIDDSPIYGEKQTDTWEKFNFYDMPSVAALTLLTKWQADVENVESIVLDFLANSVDAESFRFTEAVGKAIPSSTFIGRGDKFSAEILVYAYDPTLQGKIYLGWDNQDTSDAENPKYSGGKFIGDLVNGKGVWETKSGGSGVKKYNGYIELEQKGEMKYFPFDGEYTVGSQEATVSPDYMLAMFQGYPNPITVSVPGYNSKDLNIRVDNGTKSGSGGSYSIVPKRTGPLKVSVSGNGKNLGNIVFEVHDVPIPVIRFKGLKNGANVKKQQLISKGVPYLDIPSIVKMFKGIKYRVTGFDVIVASEKGSQQEKGCSSLQQGKGRKIISETRSGDVVTINNIRYTRLGASTGRAKLKFPGSLTFNIK